MNSELTTWLLDHYGQETMRPGLERITQALVALLPDLRNIPVITIAGTNGKGETALRLSGHLKKRKHLLWTSPHIERITERFRDQDQEIEVAELKRLILSCHESVKLHNYQLSFYEFLFFVFCTWAIEKKPELLILEVGLGGRLDAVNVLDAKVVLLPSISRDHQEILGNRYDLILEEKLATVRPNTFLISYLDIKYLQERTQRHLFLKGARGLELEKLKRFKNFEFSQRNQLLAYAAYLHLEGVDISKENFNHWTPSEELLEHRGEVVIKEREWILFGSHNPDGLRKLIQFLHWANYNFSRPPFEAVIVAFSKRDPLDLSVMLRMLKTSGLGPIVITHFDHIKAAPVSEIKKLAQEEGLGFVENIDEYVQEKNKGPVLVTGSYYFLGHFKFLLRS